MNKNDKSNSLTEVTSTSRFGAIAYSVTVSVTPDQLLKLAVEGLDKVVGGKPSSRLDMILGYNPTESDAVDRPEGWKRKAITFSDANAAKLAEVFTDYLTKQGYAAPAVNTSQGAGNKAALQSAAETLAQMHVTGAAMGIKDFVATWAKNVIKFDGDLKSPEFLAAIAASNAALPKAS